LPPALAGGIENQCKMALAKKYAVSAKALKNKQNFIPPAKAGGN
jgi:hypothetical protein